MECNGRHDTLVASEEMCAEATVDVPNTDPFVCSRRGEQSPGGVARHAHHRAVMPLPRTDALEGGEVPDTDEAAVAGGEEEAVVRAEGEGGDGLRVALEGRPDGGVGGLDELDLVVAGAGEEGAAGGGGEGAAAVELLQ